MKRVCILDYGSGNVKSVYNLFSSIVEDVYISNEPEAISKATHIVLPGVGAFAAAVRKIHEKLPVDLLATEVLEERKPFLGICVGMQVLASKGMEFGEHKGLGWVPGVVEKMETGGLPLPHVGWNNIIVRQPSPLMDGLEENPDFYFVHSYAFRPEDLRYTIAVTHYGKEFCSIIQRDNLVGVQFHPEKSQLAGKLIARNFLNLGTNSGK